MINKPKMSDAVSDSYLASSNVSNDILAYTDLKQFFLINKFISL